MKMLNRINTARFDRGQEQAQKSARANLDFILANKKALLRIRNGSKTLSDMESISKQQEKFTPNQMSYIEGAYEKVMKGMGFDSCNTKHDLNRKTLRY